MKYFYGASLKCQFKITLVYQTYILLKIRCVMKQQEREYLIKMNYIQP